MVRSTVRRGIREARSVGALSVFAFALAFALATSAAAQTSLGGQRVGTSSGDFLKIGAGAKAVAMGEAFIAIADDPSALYWNPAGIASADARAVLFSHTSWLTDVSIEYLAAIAPVPRLAGGVAGVQIAGLSTELDETTELQPDGTGRAFSYSDLLVGVGYARYFTDKFAIGWNLKYLREDLGSEVGGGVVNTWLADLGTMYHIGFHDMNFAVAISNFGPEITPNEGYVRINQTGGFSLSQDADFIGFAPPTTFKIGLSSTIFDSESFHGIGSVEMNRPGDNAETLKLGGEVLFRERIALRAGYDANADELRFSGGAGFRMTRSARSAAVDYAFTDSESFGRIDRIALVVEF